MVDALVGGTPGKDCGGFCKFCYFKSVDYKNIDGIKLGCKHCPPNQVGCENCCEVIYDIKNGFRPLSNVLSRLENLLKWHNYFDTIDFTNLKILTASWADITNYPDLKELVLTLKDWGYAVHMGYVSGKKINNTDIPHKMVSWGMDELIFSVVSLNPQIRRKWMGDKTPEKSYEALKIFCESVEVNASTVVIPGVITEEEIFNTCSILEDWGIKSFILSRFVNFPKEGLIYNKKPVIEGITTQTFQEFNELVERINKEFPFPVIGTPKNAYKLSKKDNQGCLKRLPDVTKEATIITSKLSSKQLEEIFKIIAPDLVNVIGVEKDIGDLITRRDLEQVDLESVKNKVIIPGKALIHDKIAHKLLNRDGINRRVLRGPNLLFDYNFELLDHENNIEFELKNFKSLINIINQ